MAQGEGFEPPRHGAQWNSSPPFYLAEPPLRRDWAKYVSTILLTKDVIPCGMEDEGVRGRGFERTLSPDSTTTNTWFALVSGPKPPGKDLGSQILTPALFSLRERVVRGRGFEPLRPFSHRYSADPVLLASVPSHQPRQIMNGRSSS